MKLYGIVYEDENGDFQAVSSFGFDRRKLANFRRTRTSPTLNARLEKPPAFKGQKTFIRNLRIIGGERRHQRNQEN